MSLKAAAFDLDDTLLRDDLSVSSLTLKVFRELHHRGFLFVAASGRTLMSMKPFTDLLGCVSLCIACNGAVIWDPSDCSYDFYFNEVSDYSRRYAASSMLPGEYVGNLELYIREPRTKILMMADEEKIRVMLALARKRFSGRASVTSSKPWFLEFNPPNATKGVALSKVADLLGLCPDNFIAFGDSLNDLPMLAAAGCSVAVANAWPEVKEVCARTCLSNQEDGVAKYLADCFLNKGERHDLCS